MKQNEYDIPFQVENLVNSLKNKDDPVHVRSNYYGRLDSIRIYIERALKEYDKELSYNILDMTKPRKR